MNIAYSHKFLDPIAKAQAVRDNTAHMIYTFWWDNTPNHIRENPDMQDYTKDMILEFLNDLPESNPLLLISDFVSRLVFDAAEHYEEIRG